MQIILLSGGSGKRLWPLSNEVRSKQFLSIFKRHDGSYESMVQRMYRMIHEVDGQATVTIATSENQVATIRNQLGNDVGISIEPCRRDTFPAIALATAYLHDMKGVPENEAVVVCPVDPYVESDFFIMLQKLHQYAEKGEANLVLMGVEPTYPSEKYGYIIPTSDSALSMVKTFKEKPDAKIAESYIRQGALWNAGVFAFKIGYLLRIAKRFFGTSFYEDILANYDKLTRISFDYAVAEKEENIHVMRFGGTWKDLGTWNTLTEAMSDHVVGSAKASKCENTHIINELQIPLIALGTRNLAIAATPDGILVTDKASSDQLKELVPDNRPMYEKRIWGEYKVLNYHIQPNGSNSLTKHLIVEPGKHISYQKHYHRSEIWTFVEGSGRLILDGVLTSVSCGDTVCIKVGMKHAVMAISELHIIEVQVGDELTEDDIERFDLDWEHLE